VPATPCTDAAMRYVAERRARGELARTTQRNITNCLRRFTRTLGDKPCGTITQRDITRWLNDRQHLSQGSRRTEIGIVDGFLAWLVATGRLSRNPLDGLPRPKVPRSVPAAFPAPAVEQLLEVAAGDARLTAIIWSMLGLGMRRIEVHRLNVEDWDRWGETVKVTGKGSHERILPVTAAVRRAWDRYLAEDPRATGPMFVNCHGGRLSTTSITKTVGDALTEAGIKRRAYDRACAHALRHTAASDVLEASRDLRLVQAMLGHANVATTSIYLRRSTIGEMREAMEPRRYA
jgi:site-specific recombinase XerD